MHDFSAYPVTYGIPPAPAQGGAYPVCDCGTLQRRIALHCGAVLLRRKPSALFTLPTQEAHSGELDSILLHHGLHRQILCDRCDNVLLFVYAPDLLNRCLADPLTRRSLLSIGYPMGGTLENILHILQQRTSCQNGFPHEIGFFLGYPPEDVLGFMRHKGKHCKMCGVWKVYSDVARAAAMFTELSACKRHVLSHLESGGSLFTLPRVPA